MPAKDTKRKKRVINKFRITELSAVDKPAQEGAQSVIMKRADNIVMTLADDSNHAHLLFEYGDIESGTTSYGAANNVDSHSHPFVIKGGQLIMGETHGHTHEIDVDDFNQMLLNDAIRENIERDLQLAENSEFKSANHIRKNTVEKDAAMSNGSFPIQNSDDLKKAVIVYNQVNCDREIAQHIARRARVLGLELNILKQGDQIQFDTTAKSGCQNLENLEMANTDKTAEDATAEIQKKLDTVTAELAVAKTMAELSDAEKAHYGSLTKAKQEKFLAKSKEDRAAELEMVKAADPVIYTSDDGATFHKSDDPRLVKMAQDRDADRAELKKQREANELAEFTKRAETELEFMPGTIETRTALLKAVDTIQDETEKQAVLDSLKAKNVKMSKAFETVGTSEGNGTDGKLEKSAATSKLDELAKAHAAKENMDYYDAYGVVAEANPELYASAAS